MDGVRGRLACVVNHVDDGDAIGFRMGLQGAMPQPKASNLFITSVGARLIVPFGTLFGRRNVNAKHTSVLPTRYRPVTDVPFPENIPDLNFSAHGLTFRS